MLVTASAGADAGGVREQVPDGDLVLAVGRELGEVLGDTVVELERAPLPLLRHRDRHAGLGHREPHDHRVGCHRHAGPRVADPEIGDDLSLDRRVELRAEMEAAFDALRHHRHRAR